MTRMIGMPIKYLFYLMLNLMTKIESLSRLPIEMRFSIC